MSKYVKRTLQDILRCVKTNHPKAEVLSKQYINSKTKMDFICEKGHIFSTIIGDMLYKGTWCSICCYIDRGIRSRFSLIQIIDKVEVLHPGSIITSKEYMGSSSKLDLTCENGHIFQMTWNDINSNYWCPECAPNKQKATCLAKYGVDNPNKNIDVAIKVAKSANHSYIKLHWKTNEELICVGSYEAKSVDYFNANKIDFQWQPKTFQLSTSKTYRPDLYLVFEDKWVEIKGWMRKDAQEKWDEFQTIQPNCELWNKEVLIKMGIL